MAISFSVKGVRDLSGEGDLLMALRKADLFSADFWKGLAFAGEAFVRAISIQCGALVRSSLAPQLR